MKSFIIFIIALAVLAGFIYLIVVMNFSEEIEKRKKYKEWANYTPLAEDARVQRHGINGATYGKTIKMINILLNEAISNGDTEIELAYYDIDVKVNSQIPFDIIKDYYESFGYEVYRTRPMGHVIIKWDKEDE